MRAAIEQASPSLAAALGRGERPAAARRYVRRMAGRSTPFGLMAGVSLGFVSEVTRLEASPSLRGVESRPVNGALVANPSLRESGGRLHLVDRSLAVTATPAIRRALAGDRDLPPEFLDELERVGVLVRTGAAGHVDAVRDAPGLSIGAEVVQDLARAAEVLAGLSPGRPPAAIADFCARFLGRYGDAEIPLLEALDDEAGLGLPEPPPEVEWTAREQRMLDVIASGVDEWDLAGEDLGPGRPLPGAFAVQASLAADGSLRVFGVSGPSGIRLIARHGFAVPQLADRLREHAAAEAALDPEAEYREVRWLGAREAPVAGRPPLRDPLVPADLLVRVVDGRPVLRSRVTGRRVVPRLDTAHDFRSVRDPVYRFLGLMQDPHGEGWIGWRWGALASAARLPRVRHGNLVLAPAQWRSPRVEDLPEWVCVVERGRELPVPREEAAGAELVREFLPPLGPYVHDLIVPFTAPATAPVREPRPAATGRVVFKPGSEWSSIKLFCGPATADDVLLGTVLPLVRGSRWYFLRYDQPEWHLRVRAVGIDLRPLAADERVWRAEVDTYVRETARYGDIEAAERCFHADSEAVAALLSSGIERRHLAIAGVAALMEDAGAEAAFPGLGRGEAGRVRAERAAVEEVIARGLFAERSVRWRDDLAGVNLPSLAHMHVNRVLRSHHREQEPLVYDYLSRHTGARFSPKARTPSKKSSV